MSEILDMSRSVLEIILLFSVIYIALHYLRNTRGALVMAGFLMVLASLWGLSQLLQLSVITSMIELLYGSLLLMLMIIFQPELRRALAQVGSLTILENRRKRELVGELIFAVQNMARRKCGALIVIERKIRLQSVIDDAVMIDAKVNALLLESIFYPNSPLHDGAVIIRDDHIVASRAILPLTRTENVSCRLGTRHRAALGISEESDAVTVLVSEETGSVSVAYRSLLHRDLSVGELQQLLEQLVVQKDDTELDETICRMSAEESELPESENKSLEGLR